MNTVISFELNIFTLWFYLLEELPEAPCDPPLETELLPPPPLNELPPPEELLLLLYELLPLLTLRLELELLTLRLELLAELERFTELLLVLAGAVLRLELELLTLRLELLLPEETLRLELLLLTLRDELELLLPLLTLRLALLLPVTLRLELELELVLLGRSYVVPDWVDLEVPLLTERDALERLDVAGATLLTDDELPDCDDTLRLDDELDTLRLELELELETLRFELEVELDTLRLALLLLAVLTLRLDEELTLRPADDVPEPLLTDLDATGLALLTLRLALVPENAIRSVVVRLRFLSHPPPLILRLGV